MLALKFMTDRRPRLMGSLAAIVLASAPLLTLAVSGCSKSSDEPTSKPVDTTITGDVASQNDATPSPEAASAAASAAADAAAAAADAAAAAATAAAETSSSSAPRQQPNQSEENGSSQPAAEEPSATEPTKISDPSSRPKPSAGEMGLHSAADSTDRIAALIRLATGQDRADKN